MRFGFLIFVPVFCFAQVNSESAPPPEKKSQATFFGHNMTPTSENLEGGSCSIGLQAIACGLSSQLTLGTSPWIMKDYNTNNAFVRAQISPRKTLQLGYFKSNPLPHDWGYKMEALWLNYIGKSEVHKNFNFYTNFSFQYYADENKPFSLRRPYYGNSNPFQLVASTLLENHLAGPFYTVTEVGLVQAIEKNTYLHAGASLQFRNANIHAHFGFSLTSTMAGLFQPSQRIDCQQYIFQNYMSYSDKQSNSCYANDFSMHPEFSLQMQF